MSKWNHEDVLPMVARIISELSTDGNYVTHKDITARVLTDKETAVIIGHARQFSSKSDIWIASNMVAWFSQTITTGAMDWGKTFERKRINGQWAYRFNSEGLSALLSRP